MLIKAYGLYWNPEIVYWGQPGAGNAGEMKGRVKRGDQPYEIDFWAARGIYVLHSEFRAIYIGKAFGTSIGHRVRAHLTDRLAGRWEMFSWFSVSSPRFTQLDVSTPGIRQLGPQIIVDTLEALAIVIADPALNRRREALRDAYEAEQSSQAHPRTMRSYFEEVLARLPAAPAAAAPPN
jgi:hypothetical protein